MVIVRSRPYFIALANLLMPQAYGDGKTGVFETAAKLDLRPVSN